MKIQKIKYGITHSALSAIRCSRPDTKQYLKTTLKMNKFVLQF